NNIAAMTTGHGHIQSIDGSNQGEIGTDLGKSPGDESIQNGGAIAAIITAGIALLGLLPDLFNQTDDDDARTRIAGASHEQIRDMDENELVSMINAMIDGPTGDDDEDAILKILEAHEDRCERLTRIVNRVGVETLLDNIDGPQWDQLVTLLANCGIISFD